MRLPAGVLVPRATAPALVQLLQAGVHEANVAGRQIGHDLRATIDDLVAEAHAARDDAVPIGTDRRTAAYPAPIVDGVSTAVAADRLGISPRGVRKRLERGSLRGEQQADGTWIVELPEEG